jgi:hypothetical protein
MRFAEMEYLVLKATRDIFGGEEITHAYNLDGNLNRKRNRQSLEKELSKVGGKGKNRKGKSRRIKSTNSGRR